MNLNIKQQQQQQILKICYENVTEDIKWKERKKKKQMIFKYEKFYFLYWNTLCMVLSLFLMMLKQGYHVWKSL